MPCAAFLEIFLKIQNMCHLSTIVSPPNRPGRHAALGSVDSCLPRFAQGHQDCKISCEPLCCLLRLTFIYHLSAANISKQRDWFASGAFPRELRTCSRSSAHSHAQKN